MKQVELFDGATPYSFELSEEFKWGFYKSEEHVEYVYEHGLPSEYGAVYKQNLHLTDWSKP